MANRYPAIYVFSYKGTHMASHILWFMGFN